MTIAPLKATIRESAPWKNNLDFSDLEGVPSPEPSLGLLSKLFFDEAIRTFFRNTSAASRLSNRVARRCPSRSTWSARYSPPPSDLIRNRMAIMDGTYHRHRFDETESGWIGEIGVIRETGLTPNKIRFR